MKKMKDDMMISRLLEFYLIKNTYSNYFLRLPVFQIFNFNKEFQ